MSVLDKIQGKLKKIFSGNKNESNAPFVQWIHKNMTKTHCYTCTLNHQRIFENNDDKPKTGADNHPFCECYYADVEQKKCRFNFKQRNISTRCISKSIW